ncbi:MAG TPA: metallophosphoesterase, partial [Polyangiales bacterium]|nr:metallophosphoesterase [Polyangiales bacterium]
MRIAAIGDVHLAWDDDDVQLIDAAGYDLVLFVGDLAGFGAAGAVRVARSIAKLRTPALVLPGNHDATTPLQLGSEVLFASKLVNGALAAGMSRRVARLRSALGPVPLCGYSLHRVAGVCVLAARPHTNGGPRLSFRRYLKQAFGVASMQESTARLCELFDGIAPEEPVVVLAHSGPHGLGETRESIYANDFPERGDGGDPDLTAALAHAARTHKAVRAVVAGHRHHRLRRGGERSWLLERDGVQYVN